MTLSALIRKRDTGNLATAIPAIPATQSKAGAAAVARIATVAVASPTDARPAIPSRWWRLHFPDREPLEVASFPPSTHAEILARYPDAVAAEPFALPEAPAPASIEDTPPPEPEAARDCSTCAYRPPGWLSFQRAPCGNPVTAGLSDLVGVIRYHPNDGVGCPAWEMVIAERMAP